MTTVSKELIKGTTVPVVLQVLSRGRSYGYAIIKEVERASGGALKMREGTLYPLLHSLQSDGLLEAELVTVEGERPRKYYALTPAGEALLADKRAEWRVFRGAVDALLGTTSKEQGR
jgi:PadR family transcriptional regulator PadR